MTTHHTPRAMPVERNEHMTTTTTLPVAPGPDTVGAIRTHAGNYIIPATTDGHMTCRDCGRTLPVTKFPTLPARADGIVRRQPADNAQCRPCRDARNMARKTGGSFAIVNGMPTVVAVDMAPTVPTMPTIGRDANGRPFVHTPHYIGYVPDATAPVPTDRMDDVVDRFAAMAPRDRMAHIIDRANETESAAMAVGSAA